eukprot:16428033-Heterocapsa_arctica.AAC.2
MGQKWMWKYAHQEIQHMAEQKAGDLVSDPRFLTQSHSPHHDDMEKEQIEEGHIFHPPIQEVPPDATFIRHLIFLIRGLASLGADPEVAIVGRSAGTHTAIALAVHCTETERWRAFGATVWWAKAIVVAAVAAPTAYWEWLHGKCIANVVIINSNEDSLTPVDMVALSNMIIDRTQAAAKSALDRPREEQSNLPGKWSMIVTSPLTKSMSTMVLGASGHGYTSHALNKDCLEQALKGKNASGQPTLSGIRSTKNSPGAVMGRLVRLMVSAGIEELCQDVSLQKGVGNYAGLNEWSINKTLRTYQAHYASNKGNQ